MAKRIKANEAAEQLSPFLEEGSLEPESDESNLDDEDPLTKKKKKKKAVKKRAAKKLAKTVEADDEEVTGIHELADEDEEVTQALDLADLDNADEEETKPARRSKKKIAIAAEVEAETPVETKEAKTEPKTVVRKEPTPTVAAPTPTTLSAEDLMKTMTAAFEKTTTTLREIPVEIATSLEEARDHAENSSSFVSKLTLGLSAAACVLSLLAVGLAQSSRHKQLQADVVTERPAVVARVRREASPTRIERKETIAAAAAATQSQTTTTTTVKAVTPKAPTHTRWTAPTLNTRKAPTEVAATPRKTKRPLRRSPSPKDF